MTKTNVKDAVRVGEVPANKTIPKVVYVIMTSYASGDWENPGFSHDSQEEAERYILGHRDILPRDCEIHRLTCGAGR